MTSEYLTEALREIADHLDDTRMPEDAPRSTLAAYQALIDSESLPVASWPCLCFVAVALAHKSGLSPKGEGTRSQQETRYTKALERLHVCVHTVDPLSPIADAVILAIAKSGFHRHLHPDLSGLVTLCASLVQRTEEGNVEPSILRDLRTKGQN